MKSVIFWFLVVFLILGGGVLFFKEKRQLPKIFKETISPSPSPSITTWTLEESRKIAEEAVKNSPTYRFDGFDLQLEKEEALRCEECWQFTFAFKSRHGGYGDRKNQMLTQVITSHKTVVTTEKGKVTSIVTDQTFDELNQRFIK
ncbi:MAG: hypothetical protein ACPLKP_03900 [Microgenomates group bacterium]